MEQIQGYNVQGPTFQVPRRQAPELVIVGDDKTRLALMPVFESEGNQLGMEFGLVDVLSLPAAQFSRVVAVNFRGFGESPKSDT